MIPIKENIIAEKSLAELKKMKQANVIGLILTGLIVAYLIYQYFRDKNNSTMGIAICTSYLPILYIANLSKINKAIKTK